jgi:hypothetical protein
MARRQLKQHIGLFDAPDRGDEDETSVLGGPDGNNGLLGRPDHSIGLFDAPDRALGDVPGLFDRPDRPDRSGQPARPARPARDGQPSGKRPRPAGVGLFDKPPPRGK